MQARYLFAHMQCEEALGLARQHPNAAPIDESAFRIWWEQSQESKAHRTEVWNDTTSVELPAGNEAYVADVSSIPQAAVMGQRPWAIRIVDLRHVVGFQKQIVEERVRVPPAVRADDMPSLLRFALQKPTAQRTVTQEGPGPHEFIADFLDDSLSRTARSVQVLKVVRITAEQLAVPIVDLEEPSAA